MVAYFDKANLVSFFKQLDEHPFGEDVLSILKKQLNLFFNFSSDSISEELEDQLSEFTEGVGRNRDELTIKFSENDIFSDRPVAAVSNANAIYLLDNIEQKLFNSHMYLMANVGDEINTLQKLIINEYDSSLHEQRTISKTDFNSWDKVIKYIRPFKSMVIVDRYMFSGSAAGNLGMFEYNLKKFLAHSFEKMQGQPRLVFIFQIKTNREYPEMGPDAEGMISKIVKAVKSKNKKCKKPEVALVYVSNTFSDEHDRSIITNYCRIKSGDTFVYFNSTNTIITKSSDLDFYSLGSLQYRNAAKSLKQKLSILIDEVVSRNPDRVVCNFEWSPNESLINF